MNPGRLSVFCWCAFCLLRRRRPWVLRLVSWRHDYCYYNDDDSFLGHFLRFAYFYGLHGAKRRQVNTGPTPCSYYYYYLTTNIYDYTIELRPSCFCCHYSAPQSLIYTEAQYHKLFFCPCPLYTCAKQEMWGEFSSEAIEVFSGREASSSF